MDCICGHAVEDHPKFGPCEGCNWNEQKQDAEPCACVCYEANEDDGGFTDTDRYTGE